MTKQQKVLFSIFKTMVILLSYFYIIKKLRDYDFSTFSNLDISFYYLLIFVFLLMFVNWSLEAFKWQILINKIEKTSFFNSLKTILIALTFGLFTPNRIGELFGRSLYLKSGNRIKGIIVASVGSYAQMTVTVVLGLIGFAAIFFFYGAFGLDIDNMKITGIILSIIAILMLVFFFKFDILIKIFLFLKIKQKYIEKIKILEEYSKKTLSKVLLVSFLRYVVFVFQYFLLLIFFNVNIDFFISTAAISAIFLMMNLLPNVVIADLGIRGGVAIFVLQQFSDNLQGILYASIFLWIINLIIPAIIGQIFFIKSKPNTSLKKADL